MNLLKIFDQSLRRSGRVLVADRAARRPTISDHATVPDNHFPGPDTTRATQLAQSSNVLPGVRRVEVVVYARIGQADHPRLKLFIPDDDPVRGNSSLATAGGEGS